MFFFLNYLPQNCLIVGFNFYFNRKTYACLTEDSKKEEDSIKQILETFKVLTISINIS